MNYNVRWLKNPNTEAVINCLVYCNVYTIFMLYIYVSSELQDYETIQTHLKCINHELGKQHVIQVVINNTANFKKHAPNCPKTQTIISC